MRLPDNIPSPLLPLEEMASLSGLFRGSAGRVLAKGIKSLLKIDEVEYFYAKIIDCIAGGFLPFDRM